MKHFDTVILGAGAAGMFCAGSVLRADPAHRVLVIDHARAPGEKIRISGGGRSNFTNLATERGRFLSDNPRFCASALAGYRPGDFVALVDAAGIAWHEKTLGQLFCDGSARQLVDMLLHRMRQAELWLETAIGGVTQQGDAFRIETARGPVLAKNCVVATGGKSIPKMGATGFGYDLARQFGLRLVEPRAGLVPLTFAEQDLDLCRPLAGLSVEAEVSHGSGKRATRFRDGLLFTHRGLSGPAILQISSFWRPGEEISVDLAPSLDLAADLREQRGKAGRMALNTALARLLPARLAEAIIAELRLDGTRLADQPNAVLDRLAHRVHRWQLRPVGSEGWRTAEVTVGGVDCRDLEAKHMQARAVSGLYFIGEVVDVTGWLGGYNFQWAWASGHAAAMGIAAAARVSP
ncbi:NAD(P)/FAD-dependent oxidoreductase [Paracoccus shanxieyensis]|uniref:Aminoacetone oxidase family FAD-binding enzyme n=1 Tax=Paracoccus shanxieyensis TaxID=2675752 RepID=A0A6L6ITZ2_9RHOB|nr:NAD(P)/FAD-dependent oxidoreductase [Paracoccus shanxieyensis]MTH63623.1 aminoacetone oxidase family FAD-binding enzyme [Paracoccus shanxieyensis]MTH86545.1 aminoacetone oxidase family FAD-binding enzyme [Paracoccus shanxieyensis]